MKAYTYKNYFGKIILLLKLNECHLEINFISANFIFCKFYVSAHSNGNNIVQSNKTTKCSEFNADNVIKTRLLNMHIINAGATVGKAIVFAISTRFKYRGYRANKRVHIGMSELIKR